MKRAIIFAALVFSAQQVLASQPFSETLASETGLAHSTNYDFDTTNRNLDSLSFQVAYSSTSFSSKNFTDGTASTGTISISSLTFTQLHGQVSSDTVTVLTNSALSAAAGTNTIYIASNSASALTGKTVTVNGHVLTENHDWFRDVRASSWTAISIANAAKNVPGFTATASLSTVTVTCSAIGTGCNTYTLATSTPAALVRGAATFSGGQRAATLTYNGNLSTADIDWVVGVTSSNTATNIATYLATQSGLTASRTNSAVNVSCVSSTTVCNSYTLASSTPAALSIWQSHFTGGQNPAVLRIAGVSLTEGTDWTATGTASATAKSISDAIVGNSALSSLVSSTWTTVAASTFGVVWATATSVGSSTNYSLWSSANAALTPFATAMRGGTDTGVTTASNRLHIASHGFTTALPVLYTKTAGTSPGLLVVGTTYYAVPIDANNIRLASSSSNAVAGSPVVSVATQTATGGGSFTLAPLAYAGTVVIKLQTSNDGTTFTDTPYAVTYSTTVASSTKKAVTWNLGQPNFQTARVAVTGPTQGGLALTVTARGRQSTR